MLLKTGWLRSTWWVLITAFLASCQAPAIAPPDPTATPPPSPTPGEQRVKIFLIAGGDNGQSGKKIGCNDSVVPAEVSIPATDDPLRSTLDGLLAIDHQIIQPVGYYNALYQSNLQVERIEIDENGAADIYLSGEFLIGGVCDGPRVQAQLEETALQFSQVKTVTFFVNGQPLETLLSGAG